MGRGEAQRKALDGLQAAVVRGSGLIAASCPSADATTPPARLSAIMTRLGAMHATLDGFARALAPVYGALDPVQTVDF
ncbi:UNVERIFIED_CONTAM: Spy/CpxP family protein refolding chaperone, partial [Bacteroidetes bacterium 56_B9]